MTVRKLARLAQMDWTEIGWRARTQARIGLDRIRCSVKAPGWDRRALLSSLAPTAELGPARAALAAHRWNDAHDELTRHFAASPQRFVIGAANRATVTRRIRDAFPASPADAAARADRVVAGDYDLLGYRGLRFTSPALPALDWHYDPVHDRRPPRVFWSAVPYLDPASGDHKIIWELNRHQHWLALGRAYWLTSDSKYRDRCLAELSGWLADNPPLVGINWAGMLELSLRSLSWIWALHVFVEPARRDHTPWTVDLLLGLDRQLTQIERNLSHYFSPNTHLTGEALALYVAGRSLPELEGSGRREVLGRQVLLAEIDRQIAPDGGHCERSTHYHRYTLDFYVLALAIARITNDPAAGRFEEAVARLASAARALSDDRGRSPHIGDDDGGQLWPILGRPSDDLRDSLAVAGALVDRGDLAIGPTPEEAHWILASTALSPLLEKAHPAPGASPPPSIALPETGYYVSRSADGDHLVIDAGPHGYRNAGHAHADALSLTFAVRGVPLLIDPGTGCYTVDRDLRDRMRSTALHNTVVLDGRPQSVPSGPFHWAHTADSRMLRWRTNSAFDYFAGAHDGYQPSEHRRHVLALHGDLLVVADFVGGAGSHTAAAHWHIDPRWTVRARGRRIDLGPDGRYQLVLPSGIVEQFVGDRETGLGWHAPVYGRIEPATTVRITMRADAPFWIVSVFGLDVRNRVKDVEVVPVRSDAGVLAHAIGLRIVRDMSVDDLLVAEPAAAATGATWRLGSIETDAHLLFYRARTRTVALVDGSLMRALGVGPWLALPAHVTDLHLDNLCAA